MAIACPICKCPAQEVSRTGDATGFMVTSRLPTEEEGVEYTREEWEAALDKAKERMEPGGAGGELASYSYCRFLLIPDVADENSYLSQKSKI